MTEEFQALVCSFSICWNSAMIGMIRPTVSVSVGAYIQDLTVVENHAEEGPEVVVTHHLPWQPVSLDSITTDKHKQNKYAYKNKTEVSTDCLVLHCGCLLFLTTLGQQVKLLKRSRKHSLDAGR